MGGWNGNGVYTRFFNWVNDKNAGIPITSSRFDTEDDGFASGLNNCLTRDGQGIATANLPMAGFKHTGVANAAARTDYAVTGQVQDGSFVWAGTAAGTADALTISPTPSISAYVAGQTFRFIASGANTSATPTLAVSGLAAQTVTKRGSSALGAGDLVSGAVVEVIYDGTNFELAAPSPSGTRGTIASAATVNIGAAGADYLQVTGTTTITAFDSVQAGTRRILEFAGALTLTQNATSLILPGGANITTAAGDVATMVSEGAGNWRCIAYMPAAQVPGGMPTGVVLPYTATTAPTGWLLANGQAVSRATYASLFSLIGTGYGAGDGSTTFNVPDMRGRVVAGYDPSNATGRLSASASGGASAAALGNVGGEQAHALTGAENGPHTHDLLSGSHSAQFIDANQAGVNGLTGTGSALGVQTSATQSAGSGTAHNNVQPTFILNYIIKT